MLNQVDASDAGAREVYHLRTVTGIVLNRHRPIVRTWGSGVEAYADGATRPWCESRAQFIGLDEGRHGSNMSEGKVCRAAVRDGYCLDWTNCSTHLLSKRKALRGKSHRGSGLCDKAGR